MPMNMAGIDRLVRAGIVGPALFVLAISAGVTTPLGLLALVAGFVMFATAAVGYCPLYAVLHLSTRRRPAAPAPRVSHQH